MMAATEPARSLGTLMASASPWLVAWVDRALMFAKSDRWPDATAMLAALRQHTGTVLGSRSSQSILAAFIAVPKPSAPVAALDPYAATILPLPAPRPEVPPAARAPRAGEGENRAGGRPRDRKRARATAAVGVDVPSPVVAGSTPVAPPPTGARLFWSTIVLLSLLASGAIVFVVQKQRSTKESSEGYQSAAPAEPVDHSEIPVSMRTRVDFSSSPPDAKLFIDDAPLDANPYSGAFPKDGLAHRVRAEAKDYVARTEVVVFDKEDVAVTLTLLKRSQLGSPYR